MRKVKIIATLGPASSSKEVLKEMLLSGLNVARFNMSHGTYAEKELILKNLRAAAKELSKIVGVLVDLQGPKIRVSVLERPIELKKETKYLLGHSSLQEKYENLENNPDGLVYIPSIFGDFATDCNVGDRVLFDDGKYIASITEKNNEVVTILMQNGGLLNSKKGINLPDTKVSMPSFTEKDKEDLLWGLKNNVDFFALSYVRKHKDVLAIKEFLKSKGESIPIVSKIENPEGVENISEIVDVSDFIMVARGDMGVEIGYEKIPTHQKNIIKICNEKGIPAIVATQMLESMVESPTPTRAEASDIANAVWDGADAVMLSEETTVGAYPILAVSKMEKIVIEAEKFKVPVCWFKTKDLHSPYYAMAKVAVELADEIDAKGIIVFTRSGSTVHNVTNFRPNVPIMGIAEDIKAVQKMTLLRGVYPKHASEIPKDLTNDTGYFVIVRGQKFEKGISNSIQVLML